MNDVEHNLVAAQDRALKLFQAVIDAGLIAPGISESELSQRIDTLARARFGLRRHWHRRIVRCGANTLLSYYDDADDLRVATNDLVVLDLGPVFGDWEADLGRTLVVGSDPQMQQIASDAGAAFALGRQYFNQNPALTAGELYDYVRGLAASFGWEFGAPTAGHLIGRFPHERGPRHGWQLSIQSGNPTPLRDSDAAGHQRHWILEIHFVDRTRGIGAFWEELLTL